MAAELFELGCWAFILGSTGAGFTSVSGTVELFGWLIAYKPRVPLHSAALASPVARRRSGPATDLFGQLANAPGRFAGVSPAPKTERRAHGQLPAKGVRPSGSLSSNPPYRSRAQQVAAAKQELARRAEDAVARHLVLAGYTIVARNLRFGHLEVDIVARAADLILVVEVRTRGSGALTSAHGSVGSAKRRNLRRAAARLWSKRYRHDPSVSRLRIDVAAVVFTAEGTLVDYAPAAIRR